MCGCVGVWVCEKSEVGQMDETPFDVPGGWTRKSMVLAGRSLEILLPADPDTVLDAQLADGQGALTESPEASDGPYWAALWSSAVPTAAVVSQARWRGGESVLELGCGMGVVGLAALACGLQVTFSDYVAGAVQVALANARRNGFLNAQGLQLDWQHPPALLPEQRFSVILASDILYNSANHGAILNTLERLLTPDGVCWIGDPGRFNSDEFLQRARQQFCVELRDRVARPISKTLAGQFQMFVLRR